MEVGPGTGSHLLVAGAESREFVGSKMSMGTAGEELLASSSTQEVVPAT